MVMALYLKLFDIFFVTLQLKVLSNVFSTEFDVILVHSIDQIKNILVT